MEEPDGSLWIEERGACPLVLAHEVIATRRERLRIFICPRTGVIVLVLNRHCLIDGNCFLPHRVFAARVNPQVIIFICSRDLQRLEGDVPLVREFLNMPGLTSRLRFIEKPFLEDLFRSKMVFR